MNASDPSTPGEELSNLARSQKKSLQRAVAQNPNTPLDVLNSLWEKYPDCMLANPIIAFWELTQPGQIDENITPSAFLAVYNHLKRSGEELPQHIFSPKVAKKMIGDAFNNCDPRVFDQAAQDQMSEIKLIILNAAKNERHATFFHEQAPDSVWEFYAEDKEPDIGREFAWVLRVIAQKIESPRPAFFQAARTLSGFEDEGIDQQLAQCPQMPEEITNRLVRSANPNIQKNLARCLYFSKEGVDWICSEFAEDIRAEFAHSSPNAIVHRFFVKDPSQKVRQALAANLRVTVDILCQFDIQDHPSVLRNVFKNPQASHDLQSRIFKEGHPDVKNVLDHPYLNLKSRFYLEHKSQIPQDILIRITKRARLPQKILNDLSTHPDSNIRLAMAKRLGNSHCWRATKANLAWLARFIADPDSEVRHEVCRDPRVTVAQFAELARDPVPDIRAHVVQHLLELLSNHRNSKRFTVYSTFYEEVASIILERCRDTDPNVRLVIANGMDAPPQGLNILFDDPSPEVQRAVHAHSQWPFGAVLDFEKKHPLFGINNSRHGQTTPSSLLIHEFTQGDNTFLRYIAAQSARTSLFDLRALVDDPHPAIRDMAAAKIKLRTAKIQKDKTPPISQAPN